MMLELRGISRKIGEGIALSGISMDVRDAELVAVLGPTGSGKTSLLRLVMGLDPIDEGEILWDGELLAKGGGSSMPAHQRSFSMVFQENLLLPFLTVEKNVLLGVGRRREEHRERVEEILRLLELQGMEKRSVFGLSGGEQQRVALARSLVIGPRLLLLDEPFSSLDRRFKDRLLPAFEEHLQRQRIAAIMVTHDHDEAFSLCRRVFLLEHGKLLQGGEPAAVYRGPHGKAEAQMLGDCNVLDPEQALALFGLETRTATAIMIRPEHLELDPSPPHNGTLRSVGFHGFYQALLFQTKHGAPLKIKAFGNGEYEPGRQYRVRIQAGRSAVELS